MLRSRPQYSCKTKSPHPYCFQAELRPWVAHFKFGSAAQLLESVQASENAQSFWYDTCARGSIIPQPHLLQRAPAASRFTPMVDFYARLAFPTSFQ